jgi:hypothetical protein
MDSSSKASNQMASKQSGSKQVAINQMHSDLISMQTKYIKELEEELKYYKGKCECLEKDLLEMAEMEETKINEKVEEPQLKKRRK